MNTKDRCAVCDRSGKTTLSPAVQFLTILWENRTEEVRHSWLTINSAMREGLFLAVKMGLTFYSDDLKYIHEKFRAGYWIGEGDEDFYRVAVLTGNTSAWKSVEHCKKRDPYIIPSSGYRSHNTVTDSISRLFVGAQFTWESRIVRVTSFNDEVTPPHLVACSYHPRPKEGYSTEKIERRFKITHEDIAAMRKREREAKKALEARKVEA